MYSLVFILSFVSFSEIKSLDYLLDSVLLSISLSQTQPILEVKIMSSTIRITRQQGQTFKTIENNFKYFSFSFLVILSFYSNGV